MSDSSYSLLAPEIVQTSAMDCGPASLKCLLEGFGISASYGRLREACQTDVDGTSIDTLEAVANQLGLDAHQTMLPTDFLLVPEAEALPAMVVVRLPSGPAHFTVAWRSHFDWLQIMDPSVGRRWLPKRRFLTELYVHTMPVSAGRWRQWAESEQNLAPLRRRLHDLGLSHQHATSTLEAARADPGWKSFAALDAAARMAHAVVRSGGLQRGAAAAAVLDRFFERAAGDEGESGLGTSATYWSVRPDPADASGGEQLLLRGALLLQVSGRRDREPVVQAQGDSADAPAAAPLSQELAAALTEPPSRPGRELWRFLREEGLLAPAALLAALVLSAGTVVFEALLLRGLLELPTIFGSALQRLQAAGALLFFLATLLVLELPIVTGLLRLGRHLEARLRLALYQKIPRLGDRYFHSRLTSDMAERGHSLHALRILPRVGGQLARATFALVFTTVGIVWLDPASAPLALVAACLAVALPLAAQPVLGGQELRVRTHAGALTRFHLDALLGLLPVRTHGAEQALRDEHESLLVEWARSSLSLLRASTLVEAVLSFASVGIVVLLLLSYLARADETSVVLLLVYWALRLPDLGREIVVTALHYPSLRALTLRMLEPLAAPEQNGSDAGAPASAVESSNTEGVTIHMREVDVNAGGHLILEKIALDIEPGTHVAIIGSSGAGKSSLAGLLLGWHRPASGRVLVDGRMLDATQLELLRRHTAWVDPAVQLWNRSLLHNIGYGAPDGGFLPIGSPVEQAELRALLETLPAGMQTVLGEGGALVSGGEGQRVRLARGLVRSHARLVILDEAFRGLERAQRVELLRRARHHWTRATLLCITHDLSETADFDRVLVMEGGRIVEDGEPQTLRRERRSRYRALLETEAKVQREIWSARIWRRAKMQNGRLIDPSNGAPL